MAPRPAAQPKGYVTKPLAQQLLTACFLCAIAIAVIGDGMPPVSGKMIDGVANPTAKIQQLRHPHHGIGKQPPVTSTYTDTTPAHHLQVGQRAISTQIIHPAPMESTPNTVSAPLPSTVRPETSVEVVPQLIPATSTIKHESELTIPNDVQDLTIPTDAPDLPTTAITTTSEPELTPTTTTTSEPELTPTTTTTSEPELTTSTSITTSEPELTTTTTTTSEPELTTSTSITTSELETSTSEGPVTNSSSSSESGRGNLTDDGEGIAIYIDYNVTVLYFHQLSAAVYSELRKHCKLDYHTEVNVSNQTFVPGEPDQERATVMLAGIENAECIIARINEGNVTGMVHAAFPEKDGSTPKTLSLGARVGIAIAAVVVVLLVVALTAFCVLKHRDRKEMKLRSNDKNKFYSLNRQYDVELNQDTEYLLGI